MKIISWNVNGFRAWNQKPGAVEFFNKDEQPDIFCLQETKAQPEQIDIGLFLDYPYTYLHSAEKKGYSGTAIFSKIEPSQVWYGMDNSPIENEGRIINAEFQNFILITVYTPNAKPDLARVDLRHQQWDTAFLEHMKELEKKKPVIICGDLNVAHHARDIARPDANKTSATKPGSPGFTDKEREGMQNFIDAGFIDSFRRLYPEKIQYSWWSYRAAARVRNVGWRIDYFLTSPIIKINDAIIYDQITGSDHCPVGIEISSTNT
jgi:exodeoxyribonuclease-3